MINLMGRTLRGENVSRKLGVVATLSNSVRFNLLCSGCFEIPQCSAIVCAHFPAWSEPRPVRPSLYIHTLLSSSDPSFTGKILELAI